MSAINVGAPVEGCPHVGRAAYRCPCLGHKLLRQAYHREWQHRGSQTHGRRADYMRGCRCPLCTQAHAVYCAAHRVRSSRSAEDRHAAMVVHGTRSRYQHGCRCEVCVTAHAERLAAARQATAHKESTMPPRKLPLVHGTRHGYLTHGCRCAPCVEAQRAYMRQWESTRVRRAQPAIAVEAPHGSVERWRAGCACLPCQQARLAHTADRRGMRARVLAAVRDTHVETLFSETVLSVAGEKYRQSESKREMVPFVVGQIPSATRCVSDVVIDAKLAAPKESWWTRLDQDGFTAHAQGEYLHRMRHSKFAAQNNAITDLE